jgi:excisionase family DNA binding protein
MNFPMGLNLTQCKPTLEAARNLPTAELPQLIGDLEECKAVAQARLMAPAPAPAPDAYLTIKQAAARLGCSLNFLYKNDFPFARRIGRKRLFSAQGIDEYLRKQK